MNVEDCIKRRFLKNEKIFHNIAAEQLEKDKNNVLHIIGSEDPNGVAADLASHLKNGHNLEVIGLPKTIDNDTIPIACSLGANTAAEQSALFFEYIVAETTMNPKMFIVHEVVGRKSGRLAAAAALCYTQRLHEQEFISGLGMTKERYSIYGMYIPDMTIDLKKRQKDEDRE
jgi:pyrophosphate--fructose-6-phosphate 1-phosphotransferase